jgi:DNA-binding transcriptional MerR regulator
MAAHWTLRELQDRVARALASHYAAPTNGQVRDVPDARTIRWYQTVGLVDRPSSFEGRTALYGSRHLLQIVAIKRLQGDGLKLKDVQARLLAKDDAALAGIALVPDDAMRGESTPPSQSAPSFEKEAASRSDSFWSARGSRARAVGSARASRERATGDDTADAPVDERGASGPRVDESAFDTGDSASHTLAVHAQMALTLDDITISFEPARALGHDDKAAIADAIAALRHTLTTRGILRAGKRGDRA